MASDRIGRGCHEARAVDSSSVAVATIEQGTGVAVQHMVSADSRV